MKHEAATQTEGKTMTDSPQKPDYPAILEHCQRALNGLLKGRGQNAIKDARMAECLCRVALEAIERDEKFLAATH